ncbi:carbohydrate ABC transporter permease [Streptomyces noursei]|nr:carbohydrate ABC transporter permease [Streptomyces noursei]
MTLPFTDMFLTSLKDPGDYAHLPYRFLPSAFAFANYRDAADELDLATLARTSILTALTVTVSVLCTSSLAGYALAKLRFPGRALLFRFVLATMMLPPFLLLIPHFLILAHWPLAGGNDLYGNGGAGLTTGITALVLPFTVSAFGIFLMRQFITTIPDEILEAARLDGAGELTLWWRIVLPQTTPALITLALLTFTIAWNEYIWPLLISTANPCLMTLPVGMQLLQGHLDPQRTTPLLMAALVISALPVLALFLLLQRHYVRGITEIVEL